MIHVVVTFFSLSGFHVGLQSSDTSSFLSNSLSSLAIGSFVWNISSPLQDLLPKESLV